jgi:hypothetical protein
MKRQEQAWVRQLDKAITENMKVLAKERGWKKRDWALFKPDGFLFYTIQAWNAGRYDSIDVDVQCKPYRVLDELFWDITGMPENKTQPMSLQAVGVYVAPFAKLAEWKVPINFPEQDPYPVCAAVLDECDAIVKKYNQQITTLDEYETYIKDNIKSCYQSDISMILLEIARSKYGIALEMIKKKMDLGGVSDMFFVHAKKFCSGSV